MTPAEFFSEVQIPPEGGDELVAWLREQYPHVRTLPDGSIACVCPLAFTTSVILGVNRWGWGTRFCYQSPARALEVFEGLQSEDDEPTGWVARR